MATLWSWMAWLGGCWFEGEDDLVACKPPWCQCSEWATMAADG